MRAADTIADDITAAMTGCFLAEPRSLARTVLAARADQVTVEPTVMRALPNPLSLLHSCEQVMVLVEILVFVENQAVHDVDLPDPGRVP